MFLIAGRIAYWQPLAAQKVTRSRYLNNSFEIILPLKPSGANFIANGTIASILNYNDEGLVKEKCFEHNSNCIYALNAFAVPGAKTLNVTIEFAKKDQDTYFEANAIVLDAVLIYGGIPDSNKMIQMIFEPPIVISGPQSINFVAITEPTQLDDGENTLRQTHRAHGLQLASFD